MSDFHYGPAHIYEVTWWSGLVERMVAHQVDGGPRAPDGEILGVSAPRTRRVCFYAQIDDKWVLQLNATEGDIRTIRRVATETDAQHLLTGVDVGAGLVDHAGQDVPPR